MRFSPAINPSFYASIFGAKVSNYIGNVATGCRKHNIYSGIVKLYNARTPHWTRSSVTRLKLVLANWYANSAGEALPANTATFTASIEYPVGTYTQVTFSASSSGTCAAGSTLESDWVTVSIPANTKFFARVYHSSSAGFCYYQMPTDSGNVDSANGATIEFSNTTLTDKTMSGTIGNSNSVACAYPVAIVSDTTAPTCLLIGDSICEGEDDTYDGTQHALGYLERAIEPYYGFSNMGTSGEPASTFISAGSRRAALAQYFSHIICEYGVNDMGAVASGAALVARLNNVYALVPFAGKKFIQTTLSPRSTSTDTWITKANQTVPTYYVVGAKCDAANTLIRAGGVGNSACIDLLSGAFDPADNKWLVDGTANKYTSDGIHPKQFAAKAMAALFNRSSISGVADNWYSAPIYKADSTLPTLNIDFANKRYSINGSDVSLAALATFTRTGTATYRGSDGLLKTAVTDEMRFEYDPATGFCLGALLEGAKTNIALYSEDFSNAAWTKTNGSISSSGLNPYGLTGQLLTEDTTIGNHFVEQVISVTANTVYTFSCYLKAGTRTLATIRLTDSTRANGVQATFNLSTGAISSAAASIGLGTTPNAYVEPQGNGWYRCIVTSTIDTTSTSAACGVYMVSTGTTDSYTGDGASGLYIFGGQLEQETGYTSYIPTTSSAVTRAAETLTSSRITEFYSSSTGTMFGVRICKASGTASSSPCIFSLDAGVTGKMIQLRTSAGNLFNLQISDTTSQVNATVAGSLQVGTTYKMAGAFELNNSIGARSGTLTTLDTACTIPAVTQANLGGVAIGTNSAMGIVRELRFYNFRVTNSELQRITT